MSFSPSARGLVLLRFIHGYQLAHNGACPSHTECAAGIGVRQKSTVRYLLVDLERRGLVERIAGKTRAIKLLVTPAIPRAADGAPLFAVQMGAGQ